MAEQKFLELIGKLEAEIESADASARLDMQDRLQTVLTQMQDQGFSIPRRLRPIDTEMSDEAVESMFDNMPV